jgi:hypothetical protein
MKFFRSLGSKATPHESRGNTSSSVTFEDHGESRPNLSSSVRTPVDDLGFELEGSSQVEIGSPVAHESRKDFLPSPAKASQRTYVPVDRLPLNFDSGGSGRTNPIERQSFSSRMPYSRFSQFAREPAPVFGGFPIQDDVFVGGGDFSVRRLSGVENMTTRETKRPKERNKDKEYRRLTMTRSDMPPVVPPVSESVGARVLDNGSLRQFYASPTPVPSPSSSGQPGGPQTHFSGEPLSSPNLPFTIQLVCEGRSVSQQVTERLPVVYLVYEASAIFGINPDDIQLMYFSMFPTMLDRASTLSGPPV